MKRLKFAPMLLVLMALSWMALNERITLSGMGMGLLIGAASLVITQVYLMDLEITGIPYELCPRLAYYLVRLVYDIVRCGVEVAIALLKGRPEICRVVVELPTEDHLLNAIVCNTITLTPGTISLEMQGRHAEILRLNTTGATLEKIRADIEAGYAVLKPSAAEK